VAAVSYAQADPSYRRDPGHAQSHKPKNSKNFYTYAFLREDGTPYYVGKGKGGRAWDGKASGARRPPKHPERILILKKGLTEEEAFRHERYMIFVLGRKDLGTGVLRNGTNGGEGASGAILSMETRMKMSESRRGKKRSKETCEKMSKSKRGQKSPWLGRKHSKETRAKMSLASQGEKNPLFGKQLSAEHRAKISQSLQGRVFSEETRAKISKSQKGEKGSNAKTFIFISPAGQEFVVTGRFKAFCCENGIPWQTMKQALRRDCNPPPKNGWLVRYTTV
jgi:hypothetical protein